MLIALIILSGIVLTLIILFIIICKRYSAIIKQKNEEIYHLKNSSQRHIKELGKRAEVQFDDLLHLKYK